MPLGRWLSTYGLAFASPGLERRYREWRMETTFMAQDRWTALAWTLLFLAIIRRNFSSLPAVAFLRSFCHLLVIISPCYLQLVLGAERYKRHRSLVVACALAAYVFHPGGGLYRDAAMAGAGAGATLLGTATLFVKLLVGSRTLFWLILSFGYRLPPALGVPLQAALGGALLLLKPSAPYCASLHSAATAPLFRTMADNLPLLTLMPFHHPTLSADADVCNSLMTWMQVGLGYVLPMMLQACSDYSARVQFVRRYPSQLGPADGERWLRKAQGSFSPWAITLVVWVHLQTALWYYLTAADQVPGAHCSGVGVLPLVLAHNSTAAAAAGFPGLLGAALS